MDKKHSKEEPSPLIEKMVSMVVDARSAAYDEWRHCQIVCKTVDRVLLGDVVMSYVDDDGQTRLVVRHFCGDPWPMDPIATDVEVLC